MKSRPFDPQRLDVAAFAGEGAQLEGRLPLRALDRLTDAAHSDARPAESDAAEWNARGESRPVRGAAPRSWLHLRASARLLLVCQRCLGPVDAHLDVQRSFLFVRGEDMAAQLDTDSEDDVLALTRAFDLHALVEDELLLALPLVPRHEVCPEPLPMDRDEVPLEEPAHPFAALSALKRSGSAD